MYLVLAIQGLNYHTIRVHPLPIYIYAEGGQEKELRRPSRSRGLFLKVPKYDHSKETLEKASSLAF